MVFWFLKIEDSRENSGCGFGGWGYLGSMREEFFISGF